MSQHTNLNPMKTNQCMSRRKRWFPPMRFSPTPPALNDTSITYIQTNTRRFIYIVKHCIISCLSGVVSQIQSTFSLGRGPDPLYGLQPIARAVRSPSLPFNGLHLRNPWKYINHYSFTNPKGMEGCVGRSGVYRHSGYMSTIDLTQIWKLKCWTKEF